MLYGRSNRALCLGKPLHTAHTRCSDPDRFAELEYVLDVAAPYPPSESKSPRLLLTAYDLSDVLSSTFVGLYYIKTPILLGSPVPPR